MSAEDSTIVTFDLGGVLVRICRSFEEACARANVARRPAPNAEQAILRHSTLMQDYDTGKLESARFFEGVAAALSGVYTPEEIRAVHDAWILDEYEGVADLVADLCAVRRVVTACLSNTNAAHWTQLDRFPAISGLRHRHASHLFGARKPDAEIYERFEHALGAAGERIVFFDDLALNVEAARARGWRAHLIDHEGDTAAQMRAALAREGVLGGE